MRLNDVCEIENGEIRSVDFSKLYKFSTTLPTNTALVIHKKESVAPGMFLKTGIAHSTSLIDLRNLMLLPKPQTNPVPCCEPLREARTETFQIGSDDGSLTIQLPFGMPAYINARTLKALFGAGRSDVLFRKVEERWEICPDSYRVNLADREQIFKLGRIQIYS